MGIFEAREGEARIKIRLEPDNIDFDIKDLIRKEIKQIIEKEVNKIVEDYMRPNIEFLVKQAIETCVEKFRYRDLNTLSNIVKKK